MKKISAKHPEGATSENWHRYRQRIQTGVEVCGYEDQVIDKEDPPKPLLPRADDDDARTNLILLRKEDIRKWKQRAHNARRDVTAWLGGLHEDLLKDVEPKDFLAVLDAHFEKGTSGAQMSLKMKQFLNFPDWDEDVDTAEVYVKKLKSYADEVNDVDAANLRTLHKLDNAPGEFKYEHPRVDERFLRDVLLAKVPDDYATICAALPFESSRSAVEAKIRETYAHRKAKADGAAFETKRMEKAMAARGFNKQSKSLAPGRQQKKKKKQSTPLDNVDITSLENARNWPGGFKYIQGKARFTCRPEQCHRCFGNGHMRVNCPKSDAEADLAVRAALRQYSIVLPESIKKASAFIAQPDDPAPTVWLTPVISDSDSSDTDGTGRIYLTSHHSALVVTGAAPTFLLDSGASMHMTSDRGLLKSYRTLERPSRSARRLAQLDRQSALASYHSSVLTGLFTSPMCTSSPGLGRICFRPSS